jgi:hypothetical protein
MTRTRLEPVVTQAGLQTLDLTAAALDDAIQDLIHEAYRGDGPAPDDAVADRRRRRAAAGVPMIETECHTYAAARAGTRDAAHHGLNPNRSAVVAVPGSPRQHAVADHDGVARERERRWHDFEAKPRWYTRCDHRQRLRSKAAGQ